MQPKVSWAPNRHIIMISKESRDTENRSNDCWKLSFAITRMNDILKYIQVENSYFKLNFSQYYCFYGIRLALVNILSKIVWNSI